MSSRRDFLSGTFGSLAGVLAAGVGIRLWSTAPGQEPQSDDLVAGIERQVVFNGRAGGMTWFHPRPCVIPDSGRPLVLMTLQSISGSDVFGHIHWAISKDRGATWSQPEPIPGLGRRPLDNGYQVGVCDVVPEYHPRTKTVLALGHNVYYKNGVLARPQRERWPVYVVRSPDGKWSERRRLEWGDARGSAIYTSNCGQRIMLNDGGVLVPLSFGPKGRKHRSVTAARCSFDGTTLRVERTGNELTNSAGRGLLEPSLTLHDGRFYMTIRAEDGRGYVTVSDDGLRWQTQQPWMWDDGKPLTMSTTQQHWLAHSDALFLIYTRKAEHNVNVFRWRAPLFMSKVDPSTLRLIRSSERVVLPLIGDGVNDPKHVARMGNFHPVNVTPNESWVTVGETLPHDGWAGDTLLARIRWRQPRVR